MVYALYQQNTLHSMDFVLYLLNTLLYGICTEPYFMVHVLYLQNSLMYGICTVPAEYPNVWYMYCTCRILNCIVYVLYLQLQDTLMYGSCTLPLQKTFPYLQKHPVLQFYVLYGKYAVLAAEMYGILPAFGTKNFPVALPSYPIKI